MTSIGRLCFLLALAISSGPVLALSSDRNQPMLIEADEAEIDDARGISIYRGNVKVTQGTLVLTGQEMTIINKDGDVNKVIMVGTPATYRQRPDNKDKDVFAKSTRMEYYLDPERVILLGQAEVEQAGDTMSSERIEYDIVKDQVNAGTRKPNERVQVVIQPKPRKTPKKTIPQQPPPEETPSESP